MIDAPVGFAFAAGMVAAFNPCGFAMLPAYLSWFLGQSETADLRGMSRSTGAIQAIRVSAALTTGFAAVFLIAGTLITEASITVQRWTPWLTVAIGLVLVPLGIAAAAGRQPKLALPTVQRGTRARDLRSMFWFGVSYATVSLSCTIPAFLVAVSGTFDRTGLLDGLVVFVAYALGMGAVLGLLTVTLALVNAGVVKRIRRILPFVPRVAGGLLAVAGTYVAYRGFYEIQLERGREVPTGPVDAIGDASATAVRWIDNVGTGTIGAAAVAALAAIVAIGVARRRRTHGTLARREGVEHCEQPGGIEITLLHVEDCPNLAVAREHVLLAAARAGVAIRVEERLVEDRAQAAQNGFTGSPTVLVGGIDPFAAAGSTPSMACRLYPTDTGLQGAPSVEALLQVLHRSTHPTA